jgi:hypothetical protein
MTSHARLVKKSHHVPQHGHCHQLQQGAPAGSPAQGRSSTLTSVTHAAEKGSSAHLAMSATMPGWKASRTSRPCQPFCRPPRWRDCRNAQGTLCTRDCTERNAKLGGDHVFTVASVLPDCQNIAAVSSQDYMHQSHLYVGLVGLHSRQSGQSEHSIMHSIVQEGHAHNIMQDTGPTQMLHL